MPSLFSAKNLTPDLTHALVFKGQSVSRAVTDKKITPDAQPIDFQAVVPACHNLSASGAFVKMAERGGFGPPQKPNKNGPPVDAGTQLGTHVPTLPPELREIAENWEALPEHIRLSVLALVRTSKGGVA